MEHLYRIIVNLNDKGLDYSIVEFDVKSETDDNLIVYDDIGGRKTKRIPKASLNKASASDFGFEASSGVWAMEEDIEEAKQKAKDAIEKVCDQRIEFARRLDEAFRQRKKDMAIVRRITKRRWDGDYL